MAIDAAALSIDKAINHAVRILHHLDVVVDLLVKVSAVEICMNVFIWGDVVRDSFGRNRRG